MKSITLPKVSIIVPVHNAIRTLDVCVNSIVKQSYKNIECILVENGSKDGSGKLCMEIENKYDSVKVELCSEKGVSKARNKGLALATGEIIGFCDADDFLEPDAIQNIVKIFEREYDIVSVFGAFYRGKITRDGIEKKYQGLSARYLTVKEAQRLILGCDAVMGSVWNKYYKAEILYGFEFDSTLSYCEDMHFNFKVLSALPPNAKIILSDRPLYCYMENEQSVTHQEEKLFDKKNELKYISAIKAIARDCILDKKTSSILKMKTACFAIDAIKDMNLNEKQKRLLIEELKSNYYYLIQNIWKFNWKWNIKRILYGAKILLNDKLG